MKKKGSEGMMWLERDAGGETDESVQAKSNGFKLDVIVPKLFAMRAPITALTK